MIHAIKRAKGYIYGSKHHLDYALETFELFLEKKKRFLFSPVRPQQTNHTKLLQPMWTLDNDKSVTHMARVVNL